MQETQRAASGEVTLVVGVMPLRYGAMATMVVVVVVSGARGVNGITAHNPICVLAQCPRKSNHFGH